MTPPIPPARLIAGSFALCAFSVSILVGVSVANPTSVILVRAMAAMVGCFLVGCIAGRVLEGVVGIEAGRYAQLHPVPNSGVTVRELIDSLETEKNSAAPDPEKSDNEPEREKRVASHVP